jgi:hypothetical protein
MVSEARGSEQGLTFQISDSHGERVLKICQFETVPLDANALSILHYFLERSDKYPVGHKVTLTYPKVFHV